MALVVILTIEKDKAMILSIDLEEVCLIALYQV